MPFLPAVQQRLLAAYRPSTRAAHRLATMALALFCLHFSLPFPLVSLPTLLTFLSSSPGLSTSSAFLSCSPSDPLLSYRSSGRLIILSQGDLRRILRLLVSTLGLHPSLNFHSFRRSAASLASPFRLSRVMAPGHRRPSWPTLMQVLGTLRYLNFSPHTFLHFPPTYLPSLLLGLGFLLLYIYIYV
jgi:hypothetical protein